MIRETGGHAVTELRRKLLPLTVRHAATLVPAYQAAYVQLGWQQIRSVRELATLPVVDKRQVQAEWRAFICPGLHLSHVQHTSGTTGESLFVLRSAEEQQFIERFMSDTASAVDTPGTAVIIEESYHGSSTGVPTPFRLLKGSIIDDRALETCLRLLRLPGRVQEHLGPVRAMAGTDTAIRAVTHFAQSRTEEPATSELSVIHTYGDLLPPAIRRRIEQTWSAVVIDRYSMVEHFGGASSLPGTDRYAFDPHIQPEVLHPVTRNPIQSGRGVLTLTSLYPFVQMMPLIRYWTGDAVEIIACDDDYAGLQVRILGRIDDCLQDEAGTPVLTPVEWRDALEDIHGIAFRSRRTDLTTPGIARAIGRPLARFQSTVKLDSVVAEIAAEKGAEPTTLAAEAREAVLDRAPLLAKRVRDGVTEFDVSVVPIVRFQA